MNATPIFTDKSLDNIAIGLCGKCHLHIYEGTIRSSKTVTAIQEFYEAVCASEEVLHLIAAADLDAIRENILNSQFGLIATHPETCKLVKDKIGSYYVAIRSDIPSNILERRVLLAGYTSADRWEKVLGKTLGVILVDEVNTANKQFIDECFARQVSVDNPLMIWTLNGDNPQHWVYQEYINRAKIIGNAPATIRAEMDRVEKTRGWYYTHWVMSDNPVMTPEKIERAAAIYPKGSYYYTIKILGERGVPGDLIYLDYLTDKQIIDAYAKDERGAFKYKLCRFVIGVDIGESKACNAFVLLGYTSDYSLCVVLEVDSFVKLGYAQKKERLNAFIKRAEIVMRKFNYNLRSSLEGVSVDSAEGNFINDLKGEYMGQGVNVIASYKATIKQRIDMNIVALSSGKLLFDKAAEKVYRAFSVAKWAEGKKGEEREDKGEEHIDILDATEYGQTVHMRALMLAKRAQ
jgi:PBSX family phage terminase large subunit